MRAAQLELLDDVQPMAFTRAFAMPSGDTFSIPPIREFVRRYLAASKVSIDPFARNNRWATHTNDLDPSTLAEHHMDPSTLAEHHMDAVEFLESLAGQGVKADLAFVDPPYSPRQISECYRGIGRQVSGADTQNAALYRRVRDALAPLMLPGAVVLSFGWNSAGMGKARGYRLIEMLLCTHGGAHNDTICIAERKAA